MISTAPMEQPLVAESPRELLPFDEELEGVLSLVARDEFYGAAEAAAKLWAAGFYDVRVLGCYLYGVYLDRSLQSLAVIADCLILLLDSSWSFLSPRESRARDLAVALRWLFTQILRDAQYHERVRSERWRSWQDPALIVAFAACAQCCGRLLAAMGRRQVSESCRSALVYLQSMVGQLGRAPAESSGWTLPPPRTGPEPVRLAGQSAPEWSASPVDSEAERGPDRDSGSESGDREGDSGKSKPEPSSESGESSQSKEDPEDTENTDADPSEKSGGEEEASKEDGEKDQEGDSGKGGDGSKDGAGETKRIDAATDLDPLRAADRAGADDAGSSPVRSAPPVRTSALPDSEETLPIKVSPALRLLLRRIEAFHRLVDQRRYRAAAIVLRDLLQTFRAFDPRVFLPSLVAPLFTALRPHEKALGPLLKEPQPAPAEDALLSLYLCDLDLFVRAAEDEP